MSSTCNILYLVNLYLHVLYQTIVSYDIYLYIPILVHFSYTLLDYPISHRIHTCTYSNFMLVHIYILSYHVFQLTLTKQLVHLVQQFNFQTSCGNQMTLNGIWLDSRLNEISIESKNTHNGLLTKELCKLQVVKKIRNLQHLQQQQQPLYFVIFRDLNFIFDTGYLNSIEAKVLRVLLQLESPKSEHRNSRYVLNNRDYSMFKTEPKIGLNIAPL